MAFKAKDISGQKFGKLTATEIVGKSKSRQNIWSCTCDCGNTINVRISALTTGNTKSCGCLRNGYFLGGAGTGKSHPVDLTGQRFGRLVAVSKHGRSNDRHTTWKCNCDCGSEVVVMSKHLREGATRSCGCLLNREHHEPEDHRLYGVWAGMKARCYNPKHSSYRWYGAKGIEVCPEWSISFLAFRDWAMEAGYDPTAPRGEHTIDRIDPRGGYEPGNCRWATIQEQQLNKVQ